MSVSFERTVLFHAANLSIGMTQNLLILTMLSLADGLLMGICAVYYLKDAIFRSKKLVPSSGYLNIIQVISEVDGKRRICRLYGRLEEILAYQKHIPL